MHLSFSSASTVQCEKRGVLPWLKDEQAEASRDREVCLRSWARPAVEPGLTQGSTTAPALSMQPATALLNLLYKCCVGLGESSPHLGHRLRSCPGLWRVGDAPGLGCFLCPDQKGEWITFSLESLSSEPVCSLPSKMQPFWGELDTGLRVLQTRL